MIPQLTALEEKKQSGAPNFGVVTRDVTMLGGATLLAAVFGTLLVFLIPRLVSIEQYGYWRLFLLYAGYVGFLHLGFPDGALLRWAGKPLSEFHHQIGPSLKFLVCQHLMLGVPTGLLLACFAPSDLRFIGIGILVFALIMNCVTLLQSGLQGARVFKPVAIAAAAPSGVFVVLTLLLSLRGTLDFRELSVLYILAWGGSFAYLWARVRPGLRTSSDSAWEVGKAYTLLGWPVVLANGGLSLMQSTDRLVVSAGLPIYDFAQYSLAASAMFVPVTIITAGYRVFFSHVAALEKEGRSKVYAHVSKLLLIAWSLMLPYDFLLEGFVRRFLPRYVPALPVARILLLGVLFLAEIQILQMSFSYLEGKQRQFLARTIGALIACFSIALAAVLWIRSLTAVAIGQVVALALWWVFNEWSLKDVTGTRARDWLRVLAVFVWAVVSYETALRATQNPWWRTIIYFVLIAGALWSACEQELRLCLQVLARVGASSAVEEKAEV